MQHIPQGFSNGYHKKARKNRGFFQGSAGNIRKKDWKIAVFSS
jgi:hypothetical protein